MKVLFSYQRTEQHYNSDSKVDHMTHFKVRLWKTIFQDRPRTILTAQIRKLFAVSPFPQLLVIIPLERLFADLRRLVAVGEFLRVGGGELHDVRPNFLDDL